MAVQQRIACMLHMKWILKSIARNSLDDDHGGGDDDDGIKM